jgi:hypothetical protein
MATLATAGNSKPIEAGSGAGSILGVSPEGMLTLPSEPMSDEMSMGEGDMPFPPKTLSNASRS